jgi:hypothetical protein
MNHKSGNDELLPPLPDPVPISKETKPISESIPSLTEILPIKPPIIFPPLRFKKLRCGSYLVKLTYTGNQLNVTDGTLSSRDVIDKAAFLNSTGTYSQPCSMFLFPKYLMLHKLFCHGY